MAIRISAHTEAKMPVETRRLLAQEQARKDRAKPRAPKEGIRETALNRSGGSLEPTRLPSEERES